MAMTGKMKRKGRMIIARVNRAHEIKAEFGLTAEADIDFEGVGTSHSGVTSDRPSNMSRKVMPRPTSLYDGGRSEDEIEWGSWEYPG